MVCDDVAVKHVEWKRFSQTTANVNDQIGINQQFYAIFGLVVGW